MLNFILWLYVNTAGLAVDWISDKLYYGDDCSNYIGVLDLAPHQHKMLVSGISINDIVVDPTTRLATLTREYEYIVFPQNTESGLQFLHGVNAQAIMCSWHYQCSLLQSSSFPHEKLHAN